MPGGGIAQSAGPGGRPGGEESHNDKNNKTISQSRHAGRIPHNLRSARRPAIQHRIPPLTITTATCRPHPIKQTIQLSNSPTTTLKTIITAITITTPTTNTPTNINRRTHRQPTNEQNPNDTTTTTTQHRQHHLNGKSTNHSTQTPHKQHQQAQEHPPSPTGQAHTQAQREKARIKAAVELSIEEERE